MQGRFFLHVWLTLLAAAIPAAAQEPVQPGLTPRISTATRQVTVFTALEKQLLQAVQKKDQAGLSSLLADDFTIESPNADPIAGEDWVPQVMTPNYKLKSFIIRQMSVADLGDAAVVKFDRIQQTTSNGKDVSGEYFVVDLWRKDGDSWKLANRYVARLAAALPPSKHQPKPTGKD
ncbi:MAG TPA: nuclear transport factor 2 family protein [Verrucomicrobiae bacterium]|jgi:ketosteroid isomerase-like protein|nr:nuclear transport factor 2 family protein [Verrucomicrobiae bacterium]